VTAEKILSAARKLTGFEEHSPRAFERGAMCPVELSDEESVFPLVRPSCEIWGFGLDRTDYLGARLEVTQDGGRSQPEERHGLAAEVLRIIRRRKNPVLGIFGKIFPYPPSFEEQRLEYSIPVFYQPLP
jgi:hypothetical protein